MLSLKGFVVILLVAVAQTTSDVTDNPICSSPERTRMCEKEEWLSGSFKCWETGVEECDGMIYLGHGTVCRSLDNGEDVRKCSNGTWEANDEGVDTVALKRVKRFRVRARFRARFRFRIGRGVRFIRRIGCAVRRLFRRRSCYSRPPNRRPYFSRCPSNITVRASSKHTYARVKWTVPTAADPDGGAPSVNLISVENPGSLFLEGETRVIYKARDAQGLSAYCSFYVIVNVTRCPLAPGIYHGSQSCTGSTQNIYGSVCSHTCDPGYTIQGSSQVTCGSTGSWSSAFPTCQAISCGVPTSVSHGSMTCPQGHSYPHLCVISCDMGYHVTGSPYVNCGNTGQWSSQGSCRDVQAPTFSSGCPANQHLYSGPLEAPVAVNWTDPVTQDNSGLAVTLTSSIARGTTLGSGVHVVKITATDTEGNSVSCSFVINVQVRHCSAVDPPTNSHVTCTSGYVYGSECTVTCASGYQLQGNATLLCLETGYWSDLSPSCNAITCPTPHVHHGAVTCSGGFSYPTTCTLACDSGYSLHGSAYLSCQANATWSSPGTCVDTEPPAYTNTPCQDNMEVYASRLGQPTIVTWSDPPVTDNSGSIVSLISDVASGTPFPVGVTQVTYSATDAASNSRNCSFSVTVKTLTCGLPDLEPANRTQTLMTYTCPDGYVFGASCTISCTHGYPLIGSSDITCEQQSGTYPPVADWAWPGPSSVPPVCTPNTCPSLAPPDNGALSCFLGNFGWDCLMSCQASWDVPSMTDGHFYCTNSNGFWVPATVPDCVVRMLPNRVHIQTDLFYFTGSCNSSLDDLRQKFIARLNNSTYRDACVNVPSCTVANVQVFCGPLAGRRKRETNLGHVINKHVIEKRSTHYIQVSVDIVTEYDESSNTKEEAYQNYTAIVPNLHAQLVHDANAGLFNIDNYVTDGSLVQYPFLTADCPTGTIFNISRATSAFSCAGCSKGNYLVDDTTGCRPCPVGTYTDLDNATSCTPCPAGWSTLSTSSDHAEKCQELCHSGTSSPDGFMPCDPCPPGQYKSGIGALTCDLCPADTWTAAAGATSVGDCVAADIHLRNSSVSGKVSSPWTSLTASVWFSLQPNNSVHVSLQYDVISPYTYDVILCTDDVNRMGDVNLSSEIEANKWTRLTAAASTQNSSLDVYLNQSFLQSYTFLSSASASLVMSITSPTSGVFVSGVRAEDEYVTQEEITEGSPNCSGYSSINLMTWEQPPTSVSVPSLCDAVDECLSSPCGIHGVCVNELGSYLCQCTQGWSGQDCQVPPDPCTFHPCDNGGTCVSGGSDGVSCLCDSGYRGDRCQLEEVDGGWGDWTPWSDCSATCGGQRQRQRLCNNPSPINGGANCSGSDTQTETCGGAGCPVDGGWRTWSPWTICSATCKGGEMTRSRTCDNPIPQNGGLPCQGVTSEATSCNTDPCPVQGGWSDWSSLSPCSVTCSTGTQSRNRSCDNPLPSNATYGCPGTATETTTCNLGNCPECAGLTNPLGAYLTCLEDSSPYLKSCNLTCFPGFVSTTTFPEYTCGEATGYDWSHWRNRTTPVQLPSCSRPQTIGAITLTHVVPMTTGCDSATSSAAQQQSSDNAQQTLPCVGYGVCQTSVTSQCSTAASGKRRKRSAGDVLLLLLNVTFDFGTSTQLDDNDTTAVTNYEELLSAVEESVITVTNQTASLFTVVVGGNVITPDVANLDSDAVIYCNAGSVSIDAFCVKCPAGSREDQGVCQLCPLGQYQPQPGSTSCLTCPDGLSWDVIGATDVTQCLFNYNLTQTATGSNVNISDNRVWLYVTVACIAAVVVAAAVVGAVYAVKKTQLGRNQRRPRSARNSVSPMPTSTAPLDARAQTPPPSYRDSTAWVTTPSALPPLSSTSALPPLHVSVKGKPPLPVTTKMD